jgi:ribose transport system substrate-binding protein
MIYKKQTMRKNVLSGFCVMTAVVSLGLIACKPASTSTSSAPSSSAVTAGKYVILETMTDATDRTKAKQNAEAALTKYPDLAAFAGLWSYNTPQILEALKSRQKLGKVKIFAFDEEEPTLDAIAAGHCEGTVVQQPYEFGYQSMKMLTQAAAGQEIATTPDKVMPVPAKIITAEQLTDFRTQLKTLREAGESASGYTAPAGAAKYAFIINANGPFWTYAKAGLKKAEADMGIVAEFMSPPNGTVEEQNRILQSLMLKNTEYKGVAVSPVDPANQTEVLNKTAAALPLITQDSDAPKSQRRLYIGTDNVEAGRLLGKLIKQKMPDGGKIVICVGNIDALNAKQRREGIIAELSAP